MAVETESEKRKRLIKSLETQNKVLQHCEEEWTKADQVAQNYRINVYNAQSEMENILNELKELL